jgi:phosphosulfolactate synthase (CoM biosynthesis protein A)
LEDFLEEAREEAADAWANFVEEVCDDADDSSDGYLEAAADEDNDLFIASAEAVADLDGLQIASAAEEGPLEDEGVDWAESADDCLKEAGDDVDTGAGSVEAGSDGEWDRFGRWVDEPAGGPDGEVWGCGG